MSSTLALARFGLLRGVNELGAIGSRWFLLFGPSR